MNLVGTILVYTGLLALLVGAISVLHPLRFLGIASRTFGLIVSLCGVALFLIAINLPASEERIALQRTHLDDFVPAYQFSEFHSIRINAPRQKVFRAIQEVSADEIFLFRTLTWVRRGGRSGPESILNAPSGKPLLDVALRTSFMKLAEEPDREIVLGTLVAAPQGTRLKKDPTPDDFKALHAPGFALAAMNFRLEYAANGETVLTTETRVSATDASVRKKFGAYWRVIYPGSALIRVMWLRAIRHRAELMPR
ncbi:MAG: hypothetical protein DMG35_02925 [Acidobacteria bacterium]|nr:MAG: hypothetical protein AUH86_13570 [Acidobacteria bacterium 13_1_40CM_4_58_4]OLE57788.1 MAG: hypothetical protein AUG13_02240 [Chloroflexi bacterium 13_1_20CM_2_59_7]PYT63758.1 MAG: hypothetical protein DMG35_02925 [Acidobacteriota bacterium]